MDRKNFPKVAQRYLRQLADLREHIDTDAAARQIQSGIWFKGPNVWILAFSIIIASVGLNVNSTAVIIGAMLVSPLMGPIIGIGLSIGTDDMDLLKNAAKNLLVMVIISLIVSSLYFLVSPLRQNNPTELLARTSPTIYDVLIAFFGGCAGIIENARKEKGTVLSGVAIATALMPPLCTAGYGLSHLNRTIEYGVTFERATLMQYGDRNHVHISGTASINNKGEVMHVGNVQQQTLRMWENVETLLNEGGMSYDDVMQIIVYLRDSADYEMVKRMFEQKFPHIPTVFTLAPVCRPTWLIEMECMAVKKAKNDFRDF